MDRRNRHRSHNLIRAVLALFVTVWLNMALQPCLMAAELVMPDEHSSGDCGHCPQTGYVIDDDNCAYVDSYDFDGRLPSSLVALWQSVIFRQQTVYLSYDLVTQLNLGCLCDNLAVSVSCQPTFLFSWADVLLIHCLMFSSPTIFLKRLYFGIFSVITYRLPLPVVFFPYLSR